MGDIHAVEGQIQIDETCHLTCWSVALHDLWLNEGNWNSSLVEDTLHQGRIRNHTLDADENFGTTCRIVPLWREISDLTSWQLSVLRQQLHLKQKSLHDVVLNRCLNLLR